MKSGFDLNAHPSYCCHFSCFILILFRVSLTIRFSPSVQIQWAFSHFMNQLVPDSDFCPSFHCKLSLPDWFYQVGTLYKRYCILQIFSHTCLELLSTPQCHYDEIKQNRTKESKVQPSQIMPPNYTLPKGAGHAIKSLELLDEVLSTPSITAPNSASSSSQLELYLRAL